MSELTKEERLKIAKENLAAKMRIVKEATFSNKEATTNCLDMTYVPNGSATFKDEIILIDDDITAMAELHSTGDAVITKCIELMRNSVTIPSAVKSRDNKIYQLTGIGNGAFQELDDLQSIRMPPSLKYIGSRAFAHLDSLREVILNDGLEYIGQFSFSGCPSLCSINIPGSIVDIGDGAFHFSGLKTITFPNKKMTITGKDIIGKTEIENLWIPEGITDMGQLTSVSDYLREICVDRSFNMESIGDSFPCLKISFRD